MQCECKCRKGGEGHRGCEGSLPAQGAEEQVAEGFQCSAGTLLVTVDLEIAANTGQAFPLALITAPTFSRRYLKCTASSPKKQVRNQNGPDKVLQVRVDSVVHTNTAAGL